MEEKDFLLTEAFKFSFYSLVNNLRQLLGPITIFGAALALGIKLPANWWIGVGINFLTLAIAFGIIAVVLEIYDQQVSHWTDMFLSAGQYLNIALFSLVFFIPSLVELGLKTWFGSGMEVGIIVLVVQFYIVVKFSLAGCLIVDKEANLFSALRNSLRLTNNTMVGFKLLIFWAVAVILVLLGIVPGLGIGLVYFSFPAILGSLTFIYRQLLEQSPEID